MGGALSASQRAIHSWAENGSQRAIWWRTSYRQSERSEHVAVDEHRERRADHDESRDPARNGSGTYAATRSRTVRGIRRRLPPSGNRPAGGANCAGTCCHPTTGARARRCVLAARRSRDREQQGAAPVDPPYRSRSKLQRDLQPRPCPAGRPRTPCGTQRTAGAPPDPERSRCSHALWRCTAGNR
jgi:hypothetical protein